MALGCGNKKGDDDDDNTNGPSPPAGATLTITELGATVATVSWEAATDSETAQADLEYLLYQSLADNLSTVADIEANGTAVGSYTANLLTVDLSGLDPETTYFFNVIVRDADGLKAVYDPANADTLPRVELVANLNPVGDNSGGLPGSSDPFGFIEFQGKMYFSANDGSGERFLYAYDFVNDPVKVWEPTQSSVGLFFVIFNDELYFPAANGDDNAGAELYMYDGTNAPSIVFDINNGAGASLPQAFQVFNNELVFIASENVNGPELYHYDGTNAPQLVFDTNPGVSAGAYQSGPNYALGVEYDGRLYYQGSNGTSVNGEELYSWDGINPPAMTVDLTTGAVGGGAQSLVAFDNDLIFSGSDGSAAALEPWRYDGTNAPVLIDDINPTADMGSNVTYPIVFQGNLYFQATGSQEQGPELWMYDGTNAPTLVYEWSTNQFEAGSPSELFLFGDDLCMSATGVIGNELWCYDGINDPINVTDFNTPGGGLPLGMTVIGGAVYFSATDPDIGRELWRLNP